MTNKFLVPFITLFILIFANTANSNENYCLGKDGLILPIFDGSDCMNSTDIKIDQDEFRFIIQHDASLRLDKLEDFRNNKEKILEIANSESNNNSSEKNKIEELEKKLLKIKRKSNLNKKRFRSKKAERLAKIEKRKKELEEKKLARKAEQERRKAERLAKIEKRKKEQEEKN